MPKALIDCDAFFASCEQSKNPSLRGQSVLVSGAPGSRSIVSSASYPAKRKGIKAGMPPTEALKLCPQAIIVEGDFNLYVTFNKVMEGKLRSYGFPVEVSSIDEFYVDMYCSYEDAAALLNGFSEWVQAMLGITVSIGIAPTRTLAKLASEMDKPDGMTVLLPHELPGTITDLCVERLLGIGKSTSSFLRNKGIYTLGDLISADGRILSEIGFCTDTIEAVLKGNMEGNPEMAELPPKSISCRMTLPFDTSDDELIDHCLHLLCDHVSSRLRKEGMTASRLSVTARYEDFRTTTLTRSFSRSFSSAYHIAEFAIPLWYKHYATGEKLRMLGLCLSRLEMSSERNKQLPILKQDAARQLVMEAIDRIRHRFGDHKLVLGSSLALESKTSHKASKPPVW